MSQTKIRFNTYTCDVTMTQKHRDTEWGMASASMMSVKLVKFNVKFDVTCLTRVFEPELTIDQQLPVFGQSFKWSELFPSISLLLPKTSL